MTNLALTLRQKTIQTKEDGDHLVVTARIHGDEPAGEFGIYRLQRALRRGQVVLRRGTLTLLPRLHTIAAKRDVRGVPDNANRYITQNVTGHTPDDEVRRAVSEIFYRIGDEAARLNRDWHEFDIHSVPEKALPHIINGESPHDLEFAKAIGTGLIYSGWRQSYLDLEDADLRAIGLQREDVRAYTSAAIFAAHDAGAKTSICLEAGQNHTAASVETAYQGILRALAYHGLIDPLPPLLPIKTEFIQLGQLLVRRDESEYLANNSTSVPEVRPGQLILQGDTRQVYAPNDGVERRLVHVFPNAKVGGTFGFLAPTGVS